MNLELTNQQAIRLKIVLQQQKDQAELAIMRDKRRANLSEIATIDLVDQLFLQLDKLEMSEEDE